VIKKSIILNYKIQR